MNKKGYLQISFGWLFAIIAGIFILALAIYISTKFIGIKQTQIDTETAKHIGVLLNPFEIGAETSSSTPMTTPSETRIHISCDENGVFGNQLISTSMKSLGKWTDESVEVRFKAKYVFSDETVEGKKFFLFFRPFNSPFKVADIIVLTSSEKNYCFATDISKIKRDVNNIQQENLYVFPDCPANSVRICFNNVGSGNCDVDVFYDEDTETGYVEKDGGRMEFFGNLLYGAIFSDKNLYECQVKRLMKRLNQLANLYEKKAVFVSQRGCTNNLAGDLNFLSVAAKSVTISESLNQLILPKSKDIEEKNENNEYCKLW